MKTIRLFGAPVSLGALLAAAFVSAATLPQAQAATDIQVWHSLNSHNSAVFEKLVKQFNRSQNEVSVSLKGFPSNDAIEPALTDAVKAKKAPSLVQLDDNRDPLGVSERKYIQPMYTLLTKYPIKDATWFVSPETGFMRDDKGRLLAFPYMVDVPVMFYNVNAFKKAGIQPAKPQRTWAGLQGQLVDLANKATRYCPLVTDKPVSMNLENLAAVNNQFYVAEQPAAKGKSKVKAQPEFVFDSVYVRHLALMISWVRSELMLKPDQEGKAVGRFGDNECSVLVSSSSNLGAFRDKRGLDFGVSGLPYYPEVTPKPGNPFVDGSALWATTGHSAAEEKAAAQFLAWLAQPKNAASWYQETGYLPLTRQAFDATENGYYTNLGDWRSLVAVYADKPALTSRDFKVPHYPKVRAMFHKMLDRALNGQQPAAPALTTAAAEASTIMRSK